MSEAVRLQAFFQTLGEANRLRILKFIGDRSCSVSEIVNSTRLSQPLVSHHLRVLRRAQILQTERQGPFVFYSLRDRRLLDALGMISEIVRGMEEHEVEPMFCCPPMWMMEWQRKKSR